MGERRSRKFLSRKLRIGENGHEQVVEIVSDAARQHTQALELLGVDHRQRVVAALSDVRDPPDTSFDPVARIDGEGLSLHDSPIGELQIAGVFEFAVERCAIAVPGLRESHRRLFDEHLTHVSGYAAIPKLDRGKGYFPDRGEGLVHVADLPARGLHEQPLTAPVDHGLQHGSMLLDPFSSPAQRGSISQTQTMPGELPSTPVYGRHVQGDPAVVPFAPQKTVLWSWLPRNCGQRVGKAETRKHLGQEFVHRDSRPERALGEKPIGHAVDEEHAKLWAHDDHGIGVCIEHTRQRNALQNEQGTSIHGVEEEHTTERESQCRRVISQGRGARHVDQVERGWNRRSEGQESTL